MGSGLIWGAVILVGGYLIVTKTNLLSSFKNLGMQQMVQASSMPLMNTMTVAPMMTTTGQVVCPVGSTADGMGNCIMDVVMQQPVFQQVSANVPNSPNTVNSIPIAKSNARGKMMAMMMAAAKGGGGAGGTTKGCYTDICGGRHHCLQGTAGCCCGAMAKCGSGCGGSGVMMAAAKGMAKMPKVKVMRNANNMPKMMAANMPAAAASGMFTTGTGQALKSTVNNAALIAMGVSSAGCPAGGVRSGGRNCYTLPGRHHCCPGKPSPQGSPSNAAGQTPCECDV